MGSCSSQIQGHSQYLVAPIRLAQMLPQHFNLEKRSIPRIIMNFNVHQYMQKPPIQPQSYNSDLPRLTTSLIKRQSH